MKKFGVMTSDLEKESHMIDMANSWMNEWMNEWMNVYGVTGMKMEMEMIVLVSEIA